MKWVLIESAPKDGSVVDLWFGSYRVPDCRWMEPESPRFNWPRGERAWCYYHGEWCEWVEIGANPTHWLKVIGPPIIVEKEQEVA